MPLDLTGAILVSRRTTTQTPRQDFVISRGDDTSIDLTVWADDYALEPADLTGCSVTLTLVRRPQDRYFRFGLWDYGHPFGIDDGWAGGCIAAQFQGVVADDPTTGEVSIPLPGDSTACLEGRYELIIEYAPFGGQFYAVMRGVLDVLHCPVIARTFGVVSIAPGTLVPGITPPPIVTQFPNYILLDNNTALAADTGAPLVYDATLPAQTVQPPTPEVASFVVSISPVGPRPAYVDYATVDGSATAAAGDYTPISGTLTFGATGGNSQTITVPVRPLDATKRRSTFGMMLSNPRGDTLGAALATVDIPGTFIVGVSLIDGGDMLL